MDASTSVLVVGGSLNGLTMAMLLARRRVPCLVLVRHPQRPFSTGSEGSLPDRVKSSWPAATRLAAIDRQPAKALDEALEAIGARYGAHTTDVVAMQLESPTAPRRAVRRSANAFEQRSLR